MSSSIEGYEQTYLELVRGVDAVPYQNDGTHHHEQFFRPYYKFMIEPYHSIFGYLPEKVVRNTDWTKFWRVDHDMRSLTLRSGTSDDRSAWFTHTLQRMVESNNVAGLDKPKGERLPVFGRRGELVLKMDRVAAVVFGIVSYGVQMIAYTRTDEGLKYWIPRRAKNKRSYPGMLDNCVGGALDTGETPLTCLLREASEEASLPANYVSKHAKPYGVVSYHMSTNGNGEKGHQPQVMYVYHIELAKDVVPTPSDGEVEAFELMTLEEVKTALKSCEFKANCAMTWVSYLISIGVMNAENEPELYMIMSHLHRRLDFPVRLPPQVATIVPRFTALSFGK